MKSNKMAKHAWVEKLGTLQRQQEKCWDIKDDKCLHWKNVSNDAKNSEVTNHKIIAMAENLNQQNALQEGSGSQNV